MPDYVEKEVAAALKASPDVQAACGGRVFPVKIPQGTLLPVAVFQRAYTGPEHTLCGYNSERVTVIVKSFAETYEEVKALAMAVRSAMAAAPLSALLRDELDLFENNGGVYCVHAEYDCRQHEGGFYG